MNDNFNKVFIGSGLIAEIFLHALICHKGEDPETFFVIGEDVERCHELMNKYNITAVTNPNVFISLAKVVVLAVDPDHFNDIEEVIKPIRDTIPPDALINSVTHDLKIADIERYFPNHPVMRLCINLPIISGVGIGAFCYGSLNPADTSAFARYLINSFGKVIEVKSEEEFERISDTIFAESCGAYLALNCFIQSGVKVGLTPEQSKRIAIEVFKGIAIAFDEKAKDDLIKRSLDYDDVFTIALNYLRGFDIIDDLNKTFNMKPEELKVNLEKIGLISNVEEEKYEFHYKNW